MSKLNDNTERLRIILAHINALPEAEEKPEDVPVSDSKICQRMMCSDYGITFTGFSVIRTDYYGYEENWEFGPEGGSNDYVQISDVEVTDGWTQHPDDEYTSVHNVVVKYKFTVLSPDDDADPFRVCVTGYTESGNSDSDYVEISQHGELLSENDNGII